MAEQMAKSEFLGLSTRVMEDLKKWFEEARDYYNLTTEQVITLEAAREYIDQVTVRVTQAKEAEEEKKTP